jgi:gas vesicle protein
MDAGFYVEVIALCESIIADRLESLANQISQSSQYSYETMGRLTDYLLGAKQRDSLSQEIVDVVSEIKNWTKKRNSAVHEMAKNIEGDFMEKYAKLKETAEEAIKLFRKLDNEIRKFRKSLK